MLPRLFIKLPTHMRFMVSRGWLVAAIFSVLFSLPLRAQVRPTPAQAQGMAQNASAADIARLQAQLAASGLSQDQIRARLRAAGYPESLLDAYMPGGKPDSTGRVPSDVFEALQKLGIDSDSLDVPVPGDTTRRVRRARGDTLRSIADTIRALRAGALPLKPPPDTKADSGFQLFGIDVFERQTTQFEANLAGPVPADYRIGPGDQFVLLLTGDVEAAYNLTVTREGFVVVPNVGQIGVANLTLSQLDDVMYAKLGRAYSGISRSNSATAHFSVSLSKLGTNQVSVLGDVATPGSYRISKLGTILSALYAAGGPTESGDMRSIELRRSGRTIGSLDLYDYLIAGNSSNDLRIETGDIVFVRPGASRVRVSGAVVRPATYELKAGETLRDALRMAGGFRPEADRRRLQIDRVVNPGARTASGSDRVLLDISSAAVEASAEPLMSGDVIHVLKISTRVANRIVVKGNVWSPGPIAFTPGMMVSDALKRAGGVKPDAYLPSVQITRLNPDSSQRMVSAALRDTLGTVVQDLRLESNDEIRVFSLSDYRTSRYVVVSGAVKIGGRIPYREGMTLREALLQVGGLQESASLTEAEVAHMPEDRRGGALAVTERVPLDSTYLFERGADGRYLGPPGLSAPASRAPEVTLKPYDNVLILQQPDWSLPRTAYIGGEVRYPGTYTLLSTSERLTDLIQRAGGFTPRAYPDAATFTRQTGNAGRVSIDLPAVVKDANNIDNVALVDRDSLVVPAYIPLVTVRGEVYLPVSTAFVKGARLDYYIQSAGGGTVKAETSRSYVIQPNGRVETRSTHLGLWTSNPVPQPGSTVVIPAKDPNDKRDWLQATAAFTSLLGSLVAIAAIVRR